MGNRTAIAPRLLAAPVEYDQRFMDDFANILRLYFNQLDNASPMAAASQGVGTTKVISGLSFSQPDPTTPGTYQLSLPTQADLANLRVGEVYVDTSASNVLKVKV
jgi:hypothetical protein